VFCLYDPSLVNCKKKIVFNCDLYPLHAAIRISVRRKSSPAHGPRTKQEKMRYSDFEFAVLNTTK